MTRAIRRRAFLRGVGGTAVSLPLLELMLPGKSRAAAASPVRYVVCFAGSSLGGSHGRMVVPNGVGTGWELTKGLLPLGGRAADATLTWDSLQPLVSVVSGLIIPWKAGGEVPPGGRPTKFHSSTPSPLFSGVRAIERTDAGYSSSQVMGPTSDQIVADAIPGSGKFRSLEYRVQAEQYREPDPNKGRMSWRRDATGKVVPNTPTASPRIAFDQLFRGFTPTNPAEVEQRRRLLDQDRSVLDLVRGDGERLLSRVGTADRQRLQRHFDEIRDLERRLGQIPDTGGGLCKQLADPGPDPGVELRQDRIVNDGRANGWSDETKRGRVMADLLHMALVCDMTRVATLMFTYVQSFMSVKYIINKDVDVHDTGHHISPPESDMGDVLAWHINHWAYLLDKMRATPEGDGTLLDHSVVTFLTEGGFGLDPETGRRTSHSSENMMVLVAGRAGGLKPGKHIVATARHPAAVLISAMRAAGVSGPLGEVKEDVPELFG